MSTCFLFTMHHIVSDGWSIAVLIKEVVALYSAFLADEPSPLAELTIQYADFAVWQREYLQGERLGTANSLLAAAIARRPDGLELAARSSAAGAAGT